MRIMPKSVIVQTQFWEEFKKLAYATYFYTEIEKK